MKPLCPLFLAIALFISGCNQSTQTADETNNSTSAENKKADFKEGEDYTIYQRVRILDKVGFTEPQEAYSVLLPKGWQHESEIIWNTGSACTGTYRTFKATAPDKNYSLQMYPDVVYMWSGNQELNQFNNSNGGQSDFCGYREPMNAESYLRNIFLREELGDAEIVKIEPNKLVVQQMMQQNEAGMNELRQYGAGEMNFDQTAINATVRWPDGTEGLVVLGANILEMVIPNIYDGSSSKSYTTQITNRTVFKYPKGEKEAAETQFAAIMSSFRSNPAWNDAVNSYWKNVRQQKHVAHVGKIRMMDEQTRRIGEQTIRNGQQRLQSMDNQMRSWEQSQNSQDKMHTNFIKTIREVENYKDETGTYEMTSSYSNAWSRGNGSSFIMSNNSNFDPAAVFQDQSWKEMKKVD